MFRYKGYYPLFKTIENARTISIPYDIGAGPCDQVTIPIEIDDAADIAGLDLVLDFDPAVLIPVKAELASLTQGFLLEMNYPGEGRFMVSLANSVGITEGNGALVNLVFEVHPEAREPDATGLIIHSVRLYDENADPIAGIISIDGQFTVEGEGNGSKDVKIKNIQSPGGSGGSSGSGGYYGSYYGPPAYNYGYGSVYGSYGFPSGFGGFSGSYGFPSGFGGLSSQFNAGPFGVPMDYGGYSSLAGLGGFSTPFGYGGGFGPQSGYGGFGPFSGFGDISSPFSFGGFEVPIGFGGFGFSIGFNSPLGFGGFGNFNLPIGFGGLPLLFFR